MASAEPVRGGRFSGEQGCNLLAYHPFIRTPQLLADLDRMEPGSLRLHLRFDEGGPKNGTVTAGQIIDKSPYAAMNNSRVTCSSNLKWVGTPQGGWGVKFPRDVTQHITFTGVPWMWPMYDEGQGYLAYIRVNVGSLAGTTASLGGVPFCIYSRSSDFVGWPFIQFGFQTDKNSFLQWIGNDVPTYTWTTSWMGHAADGPYGWRQFIVSSIPTGAGTPDWTVRTSLYIENEGTTSANAGRGWMNWDDISGSGDTCCMKLGISIWNNNQQYADDITISEFKWYVLSNGVAHNPAWATYAGTDGSGNFTQPIRSGRG